EGLAEDGVVDRAAVLGGGATAASALAALAELGCHTPAVYVRSLARIGPLMRAAHRMGVEPSYRMFDRLPAELGDARVVVSTLPPGVADASLVPAGRRADERADHAAGRPDGPLGTLLDVAYGGPLSALVR